MVVNPFIQVYPVVIVHHQKGGADGPVVTEATPVVVKMFCDKNTAFKV